jgi:hypothetical protein
VYILYRPKGEPERGGGGRDEPRETDPHLFLDQLREAFCVSPRKWRHSGSQELSAIVRGSKAPRPSLIDSLLSNFFKLQNFIGSLEANE